MSEKFTPRFESSPERLGALESVERPAQEAETSPEEHKSLDVEELRQNVENKALSGHDVSVERHQEPVTNFGTTKELKADSYRRTINKVQVHLSGTDKTFSKLIHKPVVEKVSDVGAKTLARPSGIVGGGLATLIGSVFSLYFAKSYGFEYNYLLFALLFVSGFFLGLIVELALKLFKRSR